MFFSCNLLKTIRPILIRRLNVTVLQSFSSATRLPVAPIQSNSDVIIRKSHPRQLDIYNIEVQCPDLIKFWHPTKNGNLKPSEISIRSSDKIWWKCPKGPDHEWFASPRSLYNINTKKINMCPFCNNRKVSITNSLATLYPELAAQWHPTRNGDMHPAKLLPSSSYNAWWKCDNGEDHVWRRMVSRRVHPRSSIENKCPFCSGADLHSNSLASCRPDLASEWDYERNQGITPETISKSSSKRVWWNCPNGHHFQATVYNRGSTHNTGCPICSGSIVIDSTCLAMNETLVSLLDFQKNKHLDVHKVSLNSKRLFYWKCPESEFDPYKASHKWHCSIADMIHVYHQQCPFCNQCMEEEEIQRLVENHKVISSSNNPPKIKNSKMNLQKMQKRGRTRRFSVEDFDSFLQDFDRL